MTFKKQLLLATCLLVLTLPACTSVKRELGVGRNSPDEFLVVKRAPLTLPPDYTLRPPGDPSEAAPAAAAANAAKTAVLGADTSPAATGSVDQALLQKMGAGSADPDIRKIIDEENGYLSLSNQTVADKLIFWNDEVPSPENIPSSVVDPAAEAERLKKNEAAGLPATTGEVPVIEKKKGTIDKIF